MNWLFGIVILDFMRDRCHYNNFNEKVSTSLNTIQGPAQGTVGSHTVTIRERVM